MRLAIAGLIVAAAIAAALWLTLAGGHGDSTPADPDKKDAALLVAKCDASMSTLDAAMGSGRPSEALALRLSTCTKAKAAVDRARAKKPSSQLDAAAERVAKHLQRLAEHGATAGSAGSS